MSDVLTSKEVRNLYGIGQRTLARWVADGCPTAGKRKHKGRGAPQHAFDVKKLSTWAGAHGRNPKGIQGNTLKAAVAPTVADAQTDKTKPDELIKQLGLMGYLERVRRQEKYMNGQFVNAVQTGAPSTEVANLSRALTIKGEELRRLEMVALKYQKQIAALCDLAEMQRLFVDLASGVRERVMALPNELAPVLREYLRDPDDVGKIHDEIKEAIIHALSALPEELPEKNK